MNLNLDPFWRSSIGFDRLLDLMDESLRYQPENNYPPYNIARTGENAYRISLAVAGFKPDQINVTVGTKHVGGDGAGRSKRANTIISIAVSRHATSSAALASLTLWR